MGLLILASIAFVGSHFLLSHPLRAPIIGRIGAGPFLGVYSLVAFATLGWMAHAYLQVPAQAPVWPVGDGLWAVGTTVMLLASILLVGSLIGNPALPGVSANQVPTPRGMFAITRHPMMWAFALWAGVHALVFPTPANFVVTLTIAILALVGAALQDRKKAQLQPDFWPSWQAVTAYLPFAALAQARAGWAAAWPSPLTLIGGIILWLAASWAHLPIAGIAAGIWRWVG